MDWKRMVVDAQLNGGIHDEPGTFGPPATSEELESLQAAFGNRAPGDLLEFLSQANGAFEPGGGYFVMDVKEMLRANEQCRKLRDENPDIVRSFDDILFFADPGTGDYFGYDLSDKELPIIRWMAIGDERTFKARDLKELIEGWFSGAISA